MTPAIVISTCALLFTVASFWWLNARPGRLRFTAVRVFSGYVRIDQAKLRIPVTLYNTGARPLVVVDLRADLRSGPIVATAASMTYRSTIKPGPGDVEDFPYPYLVPGRSVVTKFVEFKSDPEVMCTGDSLEVSVMALVDGRGWTDVGVCEIRADIIGDPGVYITYSNDAAHWPAGQREKAAEALAKVRAGLRSRSGQGPVS